jgi:hypothetical protein
MAENRLARELQTRAAFERPQAWRPAETLPEPDKQPGYVYRWVRISTMNNADPRNISGKFREGWEPVAIEEQPRFKYFSEAKGQFKDNIEIGGLLLCKAPVDFLQQRDEHYNKQAHQQMEAVDNSFMRQSDPRMPLFRERKSSASFGNGS